ncbi:MAG: M23 family metallopeptidase [Candidatus Margulisbacteria bacterium]|nr:M23 family metallopeptidase [Candidatus Margulisiibacteriota bacterium]
MSLIKLNPIDFFKSFGWVVTSPFGPRLDPFGSGKFVMHNGVDLGNKPIGEPISTPYFGIVTACGFYDRAGNTVAMRIESGVIQLFFHLQSINCKVGDRLKHGDVIGTNGNTGKVTGTHLHYELRVDNGVSTGGSVWGDPANFYLPVALLKTENPEPEQVIPPPEPDPIAQIEVIASETESVSEELPEIIYPGGENVTIKSKFLERKFLMTLAAAILLVLTDGLGMDLDTKTIMGFVSLVIGWVLAEAKVDGDKINNSH